MKHILFLTIITLSSTSLLTIGAQTYVSVTGFIVGGIIEHHCSITGICYFEFQLKILSVMGNPPFHPGDIIKIYYYTKKGNVTTGKILKV